MEVGAWHDVERRRTIDRKKNMKIEFVSGNFKLVVDGTPIVEIGNVSEDVVKAQVEIVEAGLTYIIQRDVASKAYLALAGEVGKGGKRKLPAFRPDGKTKWSRDQVAYSQENAMTFASIAGEALVRYGTFSINVVGHVKEDGASPMKIATGMVESAYAGTTEKLVAFLALVGADENSSKEAQIAATHKWLTSFRK